MDLISYFAKNTRVTFLFSLILLLFGFLGFQQLKSESIPSVDFGTVVVLTSYPGASPEEVEDLVTSKIEWGLIVGSLLALVWIPAGYLVIEQIKGKIYGPRRNC